MDLVVVTSWLPLLSEKLHEFNLEREYNSALPTDGEEGFYGISQATARIQADFTVNATEARCIGWASGSAQCYRKAARSNGLAATLERKFLIQDLQVNYSYLKFSDCLS